MAASVLAGIKDGDDPPLKVIFVIVTDVYLTIKHLNPVPEQSMTDCVAIPLISIAAPTGRKGKLFVMTLPQLHLPA